MSTKVLPLRPSQIAQSKQESIPEAVIEAFNECITEKFDRGYARVLQKDILSRLRKKGVNIDEAFAKGWLNVEGMYEGAGWSVTYDKPAYCESYEPFFVFSIKRCVS